jgi:hypothetical protein
MEFLQMLMLLVAVVLSLCGASFENSRPALWFQRIATKKWLTILGVAGASFCGAITVALVIHEPIPRVHDEFSYVLMSNTFAAGKVSTPSPPYPEFFETFHVLVRPVYASKYFPAQGLLLAIGEKLTGHPAVGIWLGSALACAATCWMLQAWIGTSWGLLGGFVMVIQYGVFSYWSQSYWGGMAAAFGGALFFGAMHRLWKNVTWQDSVCLALGVVILANSRPLEGALAVLPFASLGIWWILHNQQWKRAKFWGCIVLPAGVTLLVGACVSLSYNRAITGSPWMSPYMLHEEQYQESPPLIFMPLRPKIEYSNEILRAYYEGRENGLWARQRDLSYLLGTIARKLATFWAFYVGVFMTVPLVLPGILRRGRVRYIQIGLLIALLVLAGISTEDSVFARTLIDIFALAQLGLLWFVFDQFWERLALLTCALIIAELFAVKWAFPHYFAPACGLVLFLELAGLRRLWDWQPSSSFVPPASSQEERGRLITNARSVWHLRGFVTLLPLCCAISLFMRVEARINGWADDVHGPSRNALLIRDWSLRRNEMDQWLETQIGPQLVFVRYSSHHNVNFEWVWNHADLVHSRVIWARDLGVQHNRLLLNKFQGRTPWYLEADRPNAKLRPYTESNVPLEGGAPHIQTEQNDDPSD